MPQVGMVAVLPGEEMRGIKYGLVIPLPAISGQPDEIALLAVSTGSGLSPDHIRVKVGDASYSATH